MKKIILIILLMIPFVLADIDRNIIILRSGEGINLNPDPLIFSGEISVNEDSVCMQNRDCVLGDLTVNNLSIIGAVFNVTVTNYNVTGVISIAGNATADFFIGNGSLLTGMPFTSWNIINSTNQINNYLPHLYNFANNLSTDLTKLGDVNINTSGSLNVSGDVYFGSNVGIGATSPKEKLVVIGNINATKNIIADKVIPYNITSPHANNSYIYFEPDGSVGIQLVSVE